MIEVIDSDYHIIIIRNFIIDFNKYSDVYNLVYF